MHDDIVKRFREVAPSGVDFCSLRVVEERSDRLQLRRGVLQPPELEVDRGAMVTIHAGGGLGYAGTCDLSSSGLAEAVRRATDWARSSAERAVIDFSKVVMPHPKGDYVTPVERPAPSVSAADRIALFLSAYVLGGAFAQFPVGWIADKYDRRMVLIWISVGSILGCLAMMVGAYGNVLTVFLAAGFFGFTTFPIYSISTAHAHDFAEQHERVELSAAQMFLYAVGAIASPVIASALISGYGPASMFVFIALAHVLLILFGLVRMRIGRTPRQHTPYVYTPRTSFLIGRLLRRRDD